MLGISRWALVLGLSCGVIAAVMALLGPQFADQIAVRVHSGIREQVVWQPGSPQSVAERFSGSEDPPVYASFRFFNITNVEAVRKGAKPVLQELGPYVFAKARRKRGVHWVRGGAAVRFHDYSYHIFVPEMSNGTMEDEVTTLNIPLVGALEHIESQAGPRTRALLKLFASLVEGWGDQRVRGLFTTRSVGEMLWGYEDKLLAEAARWLPSLSVDPWFRLVGNTSSPEQADAKPATQVNTGLEDLGRVWQVEEWRTVREVRCWGEGHVERVRGTDAFQFSPGLQLNDSVEAWVGELYRAARLIANEQVSLGGVPLLRMRADMSQAEPDPRFFQTIRGLMNLTTPMAAGPSGLPGSPGPPIFLSYPHFCGADPALAQGVVGLRCLPEYHDLFLDVEPNTGITLRAAKRLMMVSWFGGKWGVIDGATRDTFLPIFWAEEGSTAGAEQLSAFAPLLRARAAEAALRRWALPAACTAALASVAALCVACVLWSDDSGGSGGGGSDEAAARGYMRLENGEGEAPAVWQRVDHEQQSGQPRGLPEAAEQPQEVAEQPQEVAEQRREPSSHPVTADVEHEQEGS